MVATFALPASAASLTDSVKAKAPALTGVLALASPSIPQTPLAAPSFGNIGFQGITKPEPVVLVPRRSSRTTVASSRSASRVPLALVGKAAAVVAPSSAGVLGIASSLAGIYYLYGGTTTAGFDCSGYTQYVFNRLGISLPRTAEEQRQAVRQVSIPEVGDLVFFGAPAGHVGIYAGNGMMWDSPHSGSAVGLRSIYSGVTYGKP